MNAKKRPLKVVFAVAGTIIANWLLFEFVFGLALFNAAVLLLIPLALYIFCGIAMAFVFRQRYWFSALVASAPSVIAYIVLSVMGFRGQSVKAGISWAVSGVLVIGAVEAGERIGYAIKQRAAREKKGKKNYDRICS